MLAQMAIFGLLRLMAAAWFRALVDASGFLDANRINIR
jgi:hypothetical protein